MALSGIISTSCSTVIRGPFGRYWNGEKKPLGIIESQASGGLDVICSATYLPADGQSIVWVSISRRPLLACI